MKNRYRKGCMLTSTMEKRIYKNGDNKRIKEKCDDLVDSENEQLRKDGKEGKTVMRDKIEDEKKEHLQLEDNKGKKEERDNLDDDKRKQIKREDNKRKKEKCDNLDNDEKEHL